LVICASAPIEAAEFDAHKNLKKIIIDFLCRNSDKGYSVREISQALGLSDEDINYTMLKLGLSDLVSDFTRGVVHKSNNQPNKNKRFRIEDVTINGITYYRCLKIKC
jgi:hypothetical protein